MNRNNITGDKLITKVATEDYREGHEKAFSGENKIESLVGHMVKVKGVPMEVVKHYTKSVEEEELLVRGWITRDLIDE